MEVMCNEGHDEQAVLLPSTLAVVPETIIFK
jgi:hypothetical protein